MSVPKAQPVTAPAGTPNPWPAYRLENAREDMQKAGEGWNTGFQQLTDCELRWQPGKLYVVAGRPGSGKTAFLLEALLRHVEERVRQGCDKAPAVFLSFEENLHAIYLRCLKRQVRVLGEARNEPPPSSGFIWYWLRTGKASGDAPADDKARYVQLCLDAAAQLDGYMGHHLCLMDGDLSGGDITAMLDGLRATAMRSKTVPSLLCCDYYQKVRPPVASLTAPRQLQLQQVADQLRRYAKGEQEDSTEAHPERAVPVLVGAQVLRRATEKDGPPELEDIREADDLANDAAGVLTLQRGDTDGRATLCELKVAVVKNRDGATRSGTNPLRFQLDGQYSRTVEAVPLEASEQDALDVVKSARADAKAKRGPRG